MKRCFKCGEVKPGSAFYRHPAMGDGLLGKCKECTKVDTKAARLARVDHYRAYDRDRSALPHRRSNAQRVGAKWRAANPDRRAAQIALGNAVRAGQVVPWPICAVPECSASPEAHHPDYDQPLQVVWLCPAHHKQLHAMARSMEVA